jgi:hypothetical protein
MASAIVSSTKKSTARQIEAAAPQTLTIAEEAAKLAVRVLNHSRAQDIAKAEGLFQQWTDRERAAKALLRGVEAREYTWGAIFKGTKEALIKAGLLDATTRTVKSGVKHYRLPLNHEDGYNAACYGPTFGTIPPTWMASVSYDDGDKYSVSVEYDHPRDMDCRARAERAIAELDRRDMNPTLLRQLIAEIPPAPLSVLVPEQIKAARTYPTKEKRLAWWNKKRGE